MAVVMPTINVNDLIPSVLPPMIPDADRMTSDEGPKSVVQNAFDGVFSFFENLGRVVAGKLSLYTGKNEQFTIWDDPVIPKKIAMVATVAVTAAAVIVAYKALKK